MSVLVIIALIVLVWSCGCLHQPPALEQAPLPPSPASPRMIRDQNISGIVNGEQVWSGVVRVTGDINSDPSGINTITILPGTTVIFSSHSDDTGSGFGKYDAWGEKHKDPTIYDEYSRNHIELNARIIARGTPENRIVFTSGNKGSPYDYEDIGLFGGSVLDYTTVEYARSGISCNGKGIIISNSTVQHVLWGGVAANNNDPVITGNEISDCGHEGIDVQPGGTPTVLNNSISRNAIGIVVITGGRATIRHNTFTGNGMAITSDRGPGCAACTVEDNSIVPMRSGELLKWVVDGKTIYQADSGGVK